METKEETKEEKGEDENHPVLPPRSPADLPGNANRSQRQDLFDCSNLDTIEALESRSRAGSGAYRMAMSKY
jgi:hypothetical protein